tara:strand:- start:835 stop:1827 length:993 start_codon:yes stop_codon:yes gene_type:complete
MAEEPEFSVIIPLYNRRDYIQRAVSSVLDQKYPAKEIIVVDDGSTDDGAMVAERIAGGHIRVIRQSNQGGAGAPARNTGMRAATGNWFAFLDADDIWLDNHLFELAMLISACPSAGLISSNFQELMEGQPAEPDTRQGRLGGYRNYFLAAAAHPGCVNSSSAALKRAVPDALGYFGNASSGPDLEYWARIALDFPVAMSERNTAIYFRGNGGNMERLASARTNTSKDVEPPIQELSDVSPALAMLASRAAHDKNLFKRADIREYINSRLDQGIRIQLVRGNGKKAKEVAALKFPATSVRSFGLNLITRLPVSTLGVVERFRKTVKHAVTL